MVPIPPKLKCFHCNRRYAENQMADHLAECERQRPYGCPTCGRRFQSAAGVNGHAAVTHTAEERQSRFKCKYADCSFGTDDRQSLQQHHDRHVVGFRRSCSRERSRSRQASVARSEAGNVQGEQVIPRRARSRERRPRPHVQAALNVQQQQEAPRQGHSRDFFGGPVVRKRMEIPPAVRQQHVQEAPREGSSRDFYAGRRVVREQSISLDEMPPSVQRQLVQEIQGRSRDSYTDPLMREIMGMPPLAHHQQAPRRGRSRERGPQVQAVREPEINLNDAPVSVPPGRMEQMPPLIQQQQEIPRRGRSRQRCPQVQAVREPEINLNDAPVLVPHRRFPIQGVERMETPPPLSDEHQESFDEEHFRQNEYAPSSRNAQLQPVPEYVQFVEQLNEGRASSPRRNVQPRQPQPESPEQNEQATSSQNIPNQPAAFVQEFMEQLQQQQQSTSSSQNAPNQPPIYDQETGLYSLRLINPTVARQIMVDQNARVDAMIFEIQRDFEELKRMETEFGAPPNQVVNAAVEHVITEYIDKFAGRPAVEEEEDEEEEESDNDENEDGEEMEEENEENENGEEGMEDDEIIVL